MKGIEIQLTIILSLSVLVSALGVAYAEYASRKHFVQLEVLRAERDLTDIDWGRLQLEQGTLANNWNVERIARIRLDMEIPDPERIVVLERKR